MPATSALPAKSPRFVGIDLGKRGQVNHAAVLNCLRAGVRRGPQLRVASQLRLVSWLSCVFLAGACVAGTTGDDADRSMKQYELAIGLQSEGNLPGAFKTLYTALELDPNNVKAHLLLANLFLLNRDDDPQHHDREAEAHFRKVIELQAGEHKIEEDLAAEAHNGLGVLFIHEGRPQAALDDLNAAVGDLFYRDAYMAWGNLGWAYLEMSNYPKAIDALSRAVRLRRDFCVGHYRLAKAFVATKDFAKADQAATSALESDPRCGSFQDAWLLRGEARMNLGNRDDARSDFERCVELQPKSDAGKSCGRYLEVTY